MEQISLKRQRPDQEGEGEQPLESFKRHRSFEDILSILEEDDDEPSPELSSFITTLQREIGTSGESGINVSSSSSEGEEEGDAVMRRLLEASDDDLGIPGTAEIGTASPPENGSIDWLSPAAAGGGALWEIEDEAANYYALLQSELFM